jgi:hypothetical protein
VTGVDPVIYDIAPGVARAIHSRYKAYVEREDVVQECLSWALTRHSWIAEQLLEATDPDKRKHAESRIAWQMRRAAERYSRREKATKSGYQITDEATTKATRLVSCCLMLLPQL